MLWTELAKQPCLALNCGKMCRVERAASCPNRVKTGKAQNEHNMSGLHPIATKKRTLRKVREVPGSDVIDRSLFDHLVGQGQQRRIEQCVVDQRDATGHGWQQL